MIRGLVMAALLAALPLEAVGAAEIRLIPEPGRLAVGQRFDVRASAIGIEVENLTVTLDGAPLAADPTIPGVFLHRDASLARPGRHVLRAEARAADGTLLAVAESEIEGLDWTGAGRGARNVILLIGDGMGLGHRTAARVFLHGLDRGRPAGWLALETLPFAGLISTSSASGLVTDSAASGHALATGTKTANRMLGVLPDDTPDRFDDNPRVEQLPSLLARARGTVSGIVTTAQVTDATPAAFVAHLASRYDSDGAVRAFADAAHAGHLRVLMGGGARRFETEAGRAALEMFAAAGFADVRSAAQLSEAVGLRPDRLLGLFHRIELDAEYDRQRRGDAQLIRDHADQPSLEAMTRAALTVLARHPDGFFLMVEGGSIDDMSHLGDAERMVWEVLAFDRAVAAALEFARATNRDGVTGNDTLVIVTADHDTGAVVLPGVVRPSCTTGRNCLQTYDSGGFPVAADTDRDGFPDQPDPERKAAIHFGASPDHYQDWRSQARPVPLALGRRGEDSTVRPNPERDGQTGALIGGVLPVTLAEGGAVQPVHTAVDVPLAAEGPGAEAFSGVHDNTEVAPLILRALGARR